MNLIELFFLISIILLGTITSYGDIKYGKIRNKWIIIFGIFGICANFIIFLNYYINGILNWSYALAFVLNIIVAFFVSFVLYYFDVWAAGDGKLFVIFSILVPLSIYSVGYVKVFPALTLLINIFLIGIAWVIISLAMNIYKKRISFKFARKELFVGTYDKIKTSTVQIFVIIWIINLFLSLIKIRPDYYINFLIMFIAIGSLGKYLLKYNKIILIIAVLRLVFDHSVYSWSFVSRFLFYIIIFGFLMGIGKNITDTFSTSIFSKIIKVKELKKGLILSDIIVIKNILSEKERKDLEKLNIEYTKYDKKYYIKYPKGKTIETGIFDSIVLHEPDVRLLKNIGFKEYSISEIIPFALFVFVGVLITYLIKGTIISFIVTLL